VLATFYKEFFMISDFIFLTLLIPWLRKRY